MEIPQTVKLKIGRELREKLEAAAEGTNIDWAYAYTKVDPVPKHIHATPSDKNIGAHIEVEKAIHTSGVEYKGGAMLGPDAGDIFSLYTDRPNYYTVVGGNAERLLKFLENPNVGFAGTRQDVYDAIGRNQSGQPLAAH